MRYLLLRLVLVCLAVTIMWQEGQMRPDPGVGFAIAFVLLMAAVFVRKGGLSEIVDP